MMLLATVLVCVSGSHDACGQYRLYWGDVHGHTTISDGTPDLELFFTYGRDVANLDFLIVTDHDFGHEAPWRMPKEDWTLIQDKVDQYTVDGRFIAIAGYEWTSQPKYWKEWVDPTGKEISERHFDGKPRYYNHKNVYFPRRVEYIFSAKGPAFMTPDLLAEAALKSGALIQNNHPSKTTDSDGWEQFAYDPSNYGVIANTEIGPDVLQYKGKTYNLEWERVLCEFLDNGGMTGFVKGTDTHDGRPAARTAVLAAELTREAVFDALRHRRNYAVTNARIVLDFRINGHWMGEEISIDLKRTGCIADAIEKYGVRIAQHGITGTPLKFIDELFPKGDITKGNVGTFWMNIVWDALKEHEPELYKDIWDWTLSTFREDAEKKKLKTEEQVFGTFGKKAIKEFYDRINNIKPETEQAIESTAYEEATKFFAAFSSEGTAQVIRDYMKEG